MGLEQEVKGGRPFLPVTDAVAKKLGSAFVSVTETWGPLHRSLFNLNNAIAITDSGGVAGGQGNLKLYTFPEGVISNYGSFCSLTTLAATGITATAALVGSVGTAAAGAADSTLTLLEANFIASIAGTLVGSAGTLKGFSGAPVAPFDGTTTPIDLYLNIAVPDAGITASSSVLVIGTISVLWTLLGDY